MNSAHADSAGLTEADSRVWTSTEFAVWGLNTELGLGQELYRATRWMSQGHCFYFPAVSRCEEIRWLVHYSLHCLVAGILHWMMSLLLMLRSSVHVNIIALKCSDSGASSVWTEFLLIESTLGLMSLGQACAHVVAWNRPVHMQLGTGPCT